MAMPYTDDDIEEIEIDTVEDFEIEGNAIVFDFDEGDIKTSDGDADTLNGLDALKQWIKKAFLTRAYVYPIYDIENEASDEDEDDEELEYESDVYGSQIWDIFLDPDMDREEKTAEIQLDIENTLSRHPDIIEAYDFEFEQEGHTLKVTYTVSSIYGDDFEEEVIINGTNG